MAGAGDQTGARHRVIRRSGAGIAYIEIDKVGTVAGAGTTGGRDAVGIMARGAGYGSRFRQVAVEKQVEAEPLARRQGRLINGGGKRQEKRILCLRRGREQ